MALTTVQTNNKLVIFLDQILNEYVRENEFSAYMGNDENAVIRMLMEPKKGGEQINVPLLTALAQTAVGSGTLAGNEDALDDYGMRCWIDWARKAVRITKAERHRESADLFGQVKPVLSRWGKRFQANEIIQAFMALPSESAPANLGTTNGQRVNGILWEAASAGNKNTWVSDNSDRVLFGNSTANYNATFATAAANVDTTNDLFKGSQVQLLKYVAKHASPRITPYQLKDGREYFVAFAGSLPFRDLKIDLLTVNQNARAREATGMEKNPIFQDGDLIYDGVIIREVPEIDDYVTNTWTDLKTAGASSARVNPVFFCGQQAMVMPWGQNPINTELAENDYQFISGVGIEMAYGVAKTFKKHPKASTPLVQWGVVSGFFANSAT